MMKTRTVSLTVVVFLWTVNCPSAISDVTIAKMPFTNTLDVQVGSNITIHCQGQWVDQPVIWIHDSTDLSEEEMERFQPLDTGDLQIFNVRREDSKTYLCQDAESNESIHTVFLRAHTVPVSVTNLSVVPKSVYALVTWSPPPDTGDYPVLGYELSYRRDKSQLLDNKAMLNDSSSEYDWTTMEALSNDSTSATIYNLKPNTTYYFRLCAFNVLGCGPSVTVMADTLNDQFEVDLANQLRDEDGLKDFQLFDDGEEATWRIWLIVVLGFLITFLIIGFGISLLLFRNWGRGRVSRRAEAGNEESLELMPHITLNPSFNIEMLEFLEAGASGVDERLGDRRHLIDAVDNHEDDHVDMDDNIGLVNHHYNDGTNSSTHTTRRLNG